MNIGENIKQMRKRNNLTQKELADKLNISYQAVSSWEHNRTEPSMGTIERLAECLDCKKSDIIGYDIVDKESDILVDICNRTKEMDEELQKRLLAYADYLIYEKEKNK